MPRPTPCWMPWPTIAVGRSGRPCRSTGVRGPKWAWRPSSRRAKGGAGRRRAWAGSIRPRACRRWNSLSSRTAPGRRVAHRLAEVLRADPRGQRAGVAGRRGPRGPQCRPCRGPERSARAAGTTQGRHAWRAAGAGCHATAAAGGAGTGDDRRRASRSAAAAERAGVRFADGRGVLQRRGPVDRPAFEPHAVVRLSHAGRSGRPRRADDSATGVPGRSCERQVRA